MFFIKLCFIFICFELEKLIVFIAFKKNCYFVSGLELIIDVIIIIAILNFFASFKNASFTYFIRFHIYYYNYYFSLIMIILRPAIMTLVNCQNINPGYYISFIKFKFFNRIENLTYYRIYLTF